MDTKDNKNINSPNYRIDFSEETTSREKTFLRDIPYDTFFTGKLCLSDCFPSDYSDGLFYRTPIDASSILINFNPPYSKTFGHGHIPTAYVRNYKPVKILLKVEER